jgi:hypothetical protein
MQNAPTVPLLSILKSPEFRQAYHQALDRAEKTPEAQHTAAQKAIEGYFGLKEIAPNAPLDPDSFYFMERPISVDGKYKFLVPGAINRECIAGRLFLLTSKAASVERLVAAKEFDSAMSAVEAVRLSLTPERVNGIISFISDAKKYYAHHDTAAAEKALATSLDHLNRAAADGLGKIKTEAEKGKRANEVAVTRRIVTELRKKLQTELAAAPK